MLLQKEQALLTGPSEASSSSCLASDLEKQELLARIHQLEAAGQPHTTSQAWGDTHDMANDPEHARSCCHLLALSCYHLLPINILTHMPSAFCKAGCKLSS